MSMFDWWSGKTYSSVDAFRIGMDAMLKLAEQEQERKTKRERDERERLEKVKLEMLAEWEPLDGMAEARMRHDMRKRYEEVTRAIRERDAERRRVEREQMIEDIATRVAEKLKENGVRDGDA